MSGFNPSLHPRGPDGKFSGGAGTRGSQRRLERVGEAIGKKIRSAFVGDKPRKAPPKPSKYEANDGWGIYKDEAAFNSAADRFRLGKMTPAERKEHRAQIETYRRA